MWVSYTARRLSVHLQCVTFELSIDVVEHDLGIEALRMLLKPLHQLRPLHAVDVARPVVHVGGGHALAALRDASHQNRR
jgi:hypothetical protein